jgi:macrolide transport system ATP-binding/permease protein
MSDASPIAEPSASDAKPPLIALRGIVRRYVVGDTEVRALDGVDLTIQSGEFVAIIGPSGSGKSTLMYLLGCLDRPSVGSYRLEGTEIATASDSELSRMRNRAIGYVFQSFNLLPTLSVTDNVALGLVYAGADPAERTIQAESYAKRFGLGQRLHHKPLELSGGQMQRVAIARGLAARPHLILADEPTGNLDSKTGAEILASFRRLHAEGHTIIIVTHDPGVAAQAQRVVRIVDGKIVSDTLNADFAHVALEAPAASPTVENKPESAVYTGGLAAEPRGVAEGVRPSDLLRMAWHQGLAAHPLRTLLTMLGIVFGIAAVIAMTAITEGGKEEQLRQIKQIGANNIQIRALDLEGTRLARVRRVNPDGVSPQDWTAVREAFSGGDLAAAAAWKGLKAELKAGEASVDSANILGLLGDFQQVVDFHIGSGRFLDPSDEDSRARVCVLGAAVAEELFAAAAPLGRVVVVGDEPFTVVGVMGRKQFSAGGVGDTAVVDRNHDVYLPHGSLRAYFRRLERDSPFDVISLRMADDGRLLAQSEHVRRMVAELHQGADDFAVAVPLEALRQAQQTKEVFNVIIVVIAAISLIVGGIGIMNIMLASVTERTREIGIRRAVGASRRDILAQFLAEAVLIATAGGMLGLGLGVGSALLIQSLFAFPVAFNGWIMLVATATSMAIGIGFGLYPAWKAARMDPVEALRT